MYGKNSSIEDIFTQNTMQAIVDYIGSLIQHDMVIANRNGMIVAATNKSRIGILNEKVKAMLANGESIHVVETSSNDTEFRPGINLPILYEGATVGAVGITGDPNEVKAFSRIIQSFVQQQLVDQMQQKNRAEQKRILSNFVYSWIFKTEYQDNESFEVQSRSLHINIEIPRVICVIDSQNEDMSGESLDLTCDHIYQLVVNKLELIDHQHVATLFGNEIVVLLSTTSTTQAKAIMRGIKDEIRKIFSLDCAIGIGSPFYIQADAKTCFEAAKLACATSREKPDKDIIIFDMFDLQLLISTISCHYKKRIYKHFFKNYRSMEAIEESILLLRCYIDNNRSINETAEKLNLHKNTVQCRLNKIEELTGYNPRDTKDLAYIYVIILIHETGVPQNTLLFTSERYVDAAGMGKKD